MIIFDEEIIKLDIVDLDYILSPYCGDCQTLTVEKSSDKNLYLLREKTVGDDNYINEVVGISDDLNEIKNKLRECVEDNEQYQCFYRSAGGIDAKKYGIEDGLIKFETRENRKILKVEYETYKVETELGEIFLVDALISVFDDEEQMYDDVSNFAFFDEKEMKKFMEKTFRNKITQEVFEY
ncbi:hypothetical protein [Campylobacter ureolyticus]|uniref:hypothetical protein n=1 Tax=Campylobacter ureolyticus TaxID=827 RepID=UPI0022B48BA6|nr:hypothetical protein [Campylobacter ureolyticus]MCZ6116914.1 hypothetical protein [Campylobacter ureolyticus]